MSQKTSGHNEDPETVPILTVKELKANPLLQSFKSKQEFDVTLLTEGAVIGFKEIMEDIPYKETGYIYEDGTTVYRIKSKDFKKIVKYASDFNNQFI